MNSSADNDIEVDLNWQRPIGKAYSSSIDMPIYRANHVPITIVQYNIMRFMILKFVQAFDFVMKLFKN